MERVLLIPTSSKCATFGLYKIAGLHPFDSIISDVKLTQAADGIRKLGVELTLA